MLKLRFWLGETHVSAVRLEGVTDFLDGLEKVAGAQRGRVVHAGVVVGGLRVVVAREAAVAVLRLPVVVFLVVVAAVRGLGWRLLLDWLWLALLRRLHIRLRFGRWRVVGLGQR